MPADKIPLRRRETMKKRLISLLLCLCMAVSVLSVTVLAAATVTSDTEWTNGTDLAQSGGVVLSGGTEAAPLTVTVSGTVTVNANISVRSGHVRITGGGTLLRGSGYTGAMISVSNGASLTLDHVTVSGNNVPASSCGIVVDAGGKLTINEGSILKEHRKNNAEGSVLYAAGTVVMNGGTIENNAGYYYGNIYLADGSSFTMNGGTIRSNSLSYNSTYGGGVFYVRGATLTINNGTISNHKGVPSYGGSIYCSSYGKVYLNGGAIIESSVTSDKCGDSIFYSSRQGSTAELHIGGNPYISDSIYLNSSSVHGSKYPYITSVIKQKLILEVEKGKEGRILAQGAGDYRLTEADLAKVTLKTNDDDTWYAVLKSDTNQLVMSTTKPSYTQNYYIRYYTTEGTGSTTDNTAYKSGESATIRENGFARTDYTFVGWNTKADGTGTDYTAGQSIGVTDDLILWAQWKYTPNSFSIHWDTDGDGQIDDTTTVAKDDMPVHANGSKTDADYDYTFTGWSPALTPATCETTYTAQFTATPKTGTTECTVTWYDADGTTVLASTTCAVGSVPAAPDIVPVKASDETYSYTFKEWVAVSGVDADGKLTGDAAFKAAYTAAELSTEDDDDTDLNGILAAILAGRDWFVDVYARDYYYSAVKWASEYGIASGVDKLHFAPKDPTTRAQLVTFLWRAAGSPEPFALTCAFTDVVMGSYYEKAVLWAIENGIAKGTSDTTFSPDAYVTRGQAVAFLARMNGVADDAAGYTHSFTDVSTADYYSNAVAWAVGSGITTGTTASTFSPEAICQRCQIVTFLYRNYRY